MDLTQNKSKIGGTFDIVDEFDGTIENGSVDGNEGTLKFKFALAKNCAPNADATLSNGNMTMTGSYAKNAKHCLAMGTFNATLQ